MTLPHHPTDETIAAWPVFSPEQPLRLLMSGCLAGLPCGVDGTSYGNYPFAEYLVGLPNVRVFPFCPEDRAFGTPRETPNIYQGNGFDVLDGRALVRMDTDQELEVTSALVSAAQSMVLFAQEQQVHLALLMDISGACGSTCIYQGRRRDRRYLRGPGVAGAALIRAKIPVVSQRDEGTLRKILEKLGASANAPFTDGLDHHQRTWYQTYFAE